MQSSLLVGFLAFVAVQFISWPKPFLKLTPIWFVGHDALTSYPFHIVESYLISFQTSGVFKYQLHQNFTCKPKPDDILPSPDLLFEHKYVIENSLPVKTKPYNNHLVYLNNDGTLVLLNHDLSIKWKTSLSEVPNHRNISFKESEITVFSNNVYVVLEVSGNYSTYFACLNELCIFSIDIHSGSIIKHIPYKYVKSDDANFLAVLNSLKEDNWQSYSHQLFKHLPHLWDKNLDTKLECGFIAKNDVIEDIYDKSQYSINEKETIDHYFNYQTHVEAIDFETNALFVSFSEGILCVNKDSLEAISYLYLPHERWTTYDDIENNSKIKKISIIDEGSGISTIGMPRLYTHITELHSSSDESSLRRLLSAQELVEYTLEESFEDVRFLLSPFIFDINRNINSSKSNLDFIRLRKQSFGKYILFHIGSGATRVYSPTGQLLWKADVSAKWQHVVRRLSFDEAFVKNFRPHVGVVDKIGAILLVGFDALVLIDRQSGDTVSSISLPSYPLSSPLLTDNVENSASDITIQLHEGIIGFSLCNTQSYSQFVVYTIITVFSSILLVLVFIIEFFVMGPPQTKLSQD